MTAAEQSKARRALAFLAQTLRPDWDAGGVSKAIEDLHADRQTLGHIARATIAAALTPTTKTPGGIAARVRDGFDGAQTAPRTPDNASGRKCDHCPGWTVPGDGHQCQPAEPTPEYRQMRAAGLPTTVTFKSEDEEQG